MGHIKPPFAKLHKPYNSVHVGKMMLSSSSIGEAGRVGTLRHDVRWWKRKEDQ